jgi:cytochrome b
LWAIRYLAGIMSIMWSLLKAGFGTIWIGLGEYFFNNSIINLLHIVSGGEADQMQIVRAILANLIFCMIIVIVYNVIKKSCRAKWIEF